MAARDVTVCSLKTDPDISDTVCLRLQYPDNLGPVENGTLRDLLDQLSQAGSPPQSLVFFADSNVDQEPIQTEPRSQSIPSQVLYGSCGESDFLHGCDIKAEVERIGNKDPDYKLKMEQLQWTLCARVLKGPTSKLEESKSFTEEESYYFCETSPPYDDQHKGSLKPIKPHTRTIIAEMWHSISGSEDRIQGIKGAIRKLLKTHLSASSDVWYTVASLLHRNVLGLVCIFIKCLVTAVMDSEQRITTMEEYLSHIYANVLEPTEVTALQDYLHLDSPGSVTVHQVAAALKATNAPKDALSALHSFCEKHRFPVDWWDDSQEAAGTSKRTAIAGGANSTVAKSPGEEAVRANMCTEAPGEGEHVLVGTHSQPSFTAETGEVVPPVVSPHVQESAKGSNIPITFHSYLRSTTVGIKRGEAMTESEAFKYDVMHQLEEVFKNNPSALGLFIPFVSPKGFQQREDLPSLVDGAEEMKKAFSFLGHAVFELKPFVNLKSWQLKAALEGIAAMASKCPASYKQICVYFTGHGGENVVYTPDGEVSISSFTNPFCTATDKQVVFIFDACSFGNKKIPQNSVNTICVFASIPGNRAFSRPGGYGLLTYHLSKAIQTISEPFSVVVAAAAKEIRKEINEHPEYGTVKPAEIQPLVYQATSETPLNLLEERRKAMTPMIKEIERHPTAVTVTVSFDDLASYFNLTGCSVQCEGPNGFEQCQQVSLLGTNQVCIDGLSPGKEYKLKAVSKYAPEEEVFSEEKRVCIPAGVIPTVQHGRTGTSVFVTPPPLYQQYNLQNLSVKYWAEDEGEERSQTVKVEVGAGQDQIPVDLPSTQPAKTYKVKAVVMCDYPPESEVSSHILTLHIEGTCTKMKSFWSRHKKECILYLLVALLFPVLGTITGVVYNKLTSEAQVMEFAYQGDTIFLGEIDSIKRKQVSVQDCATTYDEPHNLAVYRVKTRQNHLMLHDTICNYSEPGYSVRDHECIVLPDYGEAPPAYLMWGSKISAHVCLSSMNHSTKSYQAHSYISRAKDVDDLENCRSDVIHQKPYKTLEIGSNNRSVCTWLNFSVKESDPPGYYKPYLVIPGQVHISYNISFYIKYLNRTDYIEDVVCKETLQFDSCRMSIPGGLNHEHYTVLVYVLEYESSLGNNTPSDVQPTTHVCMNGKKFLGVEKLIAEIFGGITGLFILTVCLFCSVRYLRHRHRCGYTPLAHHE